MRGRGRLSLLSQELWGGRTGEKQFLWGWEKNGQEQLQLLLSLRTFVGGEDGYNI